MVPQRRGTLAYDSTSVSNASFAIPLTVTDASGNPVSLVNGDWGVVLLVWFGSLTSLTTSWTVLLAPTQANQISFAVIGRQYVSATDTVVDVALGDTRYLVAVGSWYSGVARIDAVGPLGINPPAVLNTVTAPSMTASGVTDELALVLFASVIKDGPPTYTLNRATRAVSQAGSPGTVFGLLAELTVPTSGPTGDVLATSDQYVQSAAGIQLGLLAVGARVGGVAAFGPTVTLAATGKQILKDSAAFAASVVLSATGNPGSRANFTPTVRLATRGYPMAHVNFRPTVALATTGRIRSTAAFGVTVALAATGKAVPHAVVQFTPTVRLSVIGIKKVTGHPAFTPTVRLTTVGRLLSRSRPLFEVQVRLAATGKPIVLGAQAHFTPTVQLFTRHNVVKVSGAPHFTPQVRLAAAASLIHASGTAAFRPTVSLHVVGTPNFTPVGAATFRPTVTLTADGFPLPRGPVGITVKPVLIEPDPDWHETPKAEYDWTVDLPVGEASFGARVTLAATGFRVSAHLVAAASHTWSVPG
jgi:hypothetical protein